MQRITFDTPLGRMALEGEGEVLRRLYLPGDSLPQSAGEETAVLALGRTQLLEYLVGARRQFDLPLDPQGTPFQCRVWAALGQIPYGAVCSYGDLARAADSPRGFRAVGMANNRNPLAIFIPCHRVIGGDRRLVGYGGGLPMKQALLQLEGHRITGERVE